MDRPAPLPLRGTLIFGALLLAIVYETQPDFQRWVNYQVLKAGEWLRYSVEWLAWKGRQQDRKRRGI